MKIKDLISKEILTVYGIYWHGHKTCFYCFPQNGARISSIDEDEVQVTDHTIDSDFEYKRTNQLVAGFFHKHLLGEDMMDGLLEHDPQAYRTFVSLLGREP